MKQITEYLLPTTTMVNKTFLHLKQQKLKTGDRVRINHLKTGKIITITDDVIVIKLDGIDKYEFLARVRINELKKL